MIKVSVITDSDGNYLGIEMKGHSGYDEYSRDIICAAASALTLNMANSVEEFTEDPFEGSVEEETGHFQFRFTGNISAGSTLLMKSLVLGLRNISESYGEKYIKIGFKEV